MSTELDKIVSKLAIESGVEPTMGVIFEPHEVEKGDMIVFRDMSQDPPTRVVGVCMANENGMLALTVALEQTLLYRVYFTEIENLQLLYRTHNPIYHCELNDICIKVRDYCGKNDRWEDAEDMMIKHFIEWHQEKFHPTPPPKLSFFKKLRKFIWE